MKFPFSLASAWFNHFISDIQIFFPFTKNEEEKETTENIHYATSYCRNWQHHLDLEI